MVPRNHLLVATALLLVVPLSLARGSGTVNGRGRFEKIKGRPSAGYQELYEWNGFLSAEGAAGATQSYRLGAGTGGGYYEWTAPAGDYNIYVSQPIFFARPKLVMGVHINEGQTITQNTELNLDYSCYFTSWWPDYQQVWYQTFVATGTSINRVSFRLAGTNATSMTVSVLHDTGGSVTTWAQVGSSKSLPVGGTGDHWVGYRSGQIPTTPGERYAVRLVGSGGSDGKFAPFARQEDGNGYANGQAYDASGTARNIDLNVCVFSDNDGTVIYYCGTGGAIEELTEWCGTCGQTFRASGSSLAACDLWFAGPDWNIDASVTIRANGPGGAQIGYSKVGHGAWSPGGTGMMGVSWAEGEVPLTPGNTYYIEMSVIAGGSGWNPLKFYKAEDAYANGQAFISSGSRTYDLNMTIMEYAQVARPTISRSPASLSRTTREGQNPTSQTFTVANSGEGTLQYTITDDADWMYVQPASGSSTGESDTITVIYTAGGLAPGQYSGLITIRDVNATNNPQTIAVALTVNPATSPGFYEPGWNLTSVPVVPTNPEASAVFQDLVALGNDLYHNLYRYDTGVGYAIYPTAFTDISRGRGYWLWLATAGPSNVVSVAGQVATTSVSLPLPQGWSLIGHPFARPVLLSSCQVTDGVTTRSFDNAVAAGWVSSTLYYWDPAVGYQILTAAGYGNDTSLRPWRGYWINALADGLQLVVPPPA